MMVCTPLSTSQSQIEIICLCPFRRDCVRLSLECNLSWSSSPLSWTDGNGYNSRMPPKISKKSETFFLKFSSEFQDLCLEHKHMNHSFFRRCPVFLTGLMRRTCTFHHIYHKKILLLCKKLCLLIMLLYKCIYSRFKVFAIFTDKIVKSFFFGRSSFCTLYSFIRIETDEALFFIVRSHMYCEETCLL